MATESTYMNITTSSSSASSSTAEVESDATNAVDALFVKDARIVVLYVIIILGLLGAALVLCWLWYNRRRKSRVNSLILHVAFSDLCVILFACLPQLIWEYTDRNWALGEVMCKLLKYVQSFAIAASNYMIVTLSLDRHQAIRAPLREPFAVWKMTLCGWGWAGLLSLPQLGIYNVVLVDDPSSPFYNVTVCESIWRHRPRAERQAYITFIDIIVFFVPFLVILFCYVRIFLKIADKAKESQSKKITMKPGKVHLQSTASSSLPKAKIKTLKMTVVMVINFIICGMPYPILELIYSYGDHRSVDPLLAAVLGAMAVSNSATNPFVFLLFNGNTKCLHGVLTTVLPRRLVERLGYYERSAGARSDYSINRSDYTTVNTEISRGISKAYTNDVHDALELSSKKKTRKKDGVCYPVIVDGDTSTVKL